MKAPEENQFTIKDRVSTSGIGLHTGSEARMTFLPAEPGSGISFCRTDLDGAPIVKASLDKVKGLFRGTSISDNGAEVNTIEHVMAAIHGVGITNIRIELDGPEPPACDGSAFPFVSLLKEAGKTCQENPIELCSLSQIFTVGNGEKSITYLPSNKFEVTFTLAYGDKFIPQQTCHVEINEELFAQRISRARTFGFTREFEMLKEKRLALGGSLENAVVVNDDGSFLNPEGVRDSQEFVLHKILDLVGDLALIGRKIKGHIVAHKTGHEYNILFARKLCQMFHSSRERNNAPMMNIEEIRSILPHRYPLLLVDRMLSIDPGKTAVGIKNVTANEEFFNGHFPQKAVMPGVLIVESMAQVAGVMFLSQDKHRGKLPFFCGIDKVRFRKPVVPGDQLVIEAQVTKLRGSTGKVNVEAKVDGDTVASGELMFTMI